MATKDEDVALSRKRKRKKDKKKKKLRTQRKGIRDDWLMRIGMGVNGVGKEVQLHGSTRVAATNLSTTSPYEKCIIIRWWQLTSKSINVCRRLYWIELNWRRDESMTHPTITTQYSGWVTAVKTLVRYLPGRSDWLLMASILHRSPRPPSSKLLLILALAGYATPSFLSPFF